MNTTRPKYTLIKYHVMNAHVDGWWRCVMRLFARQRSETGQMPIHEGEHTVQGGVGTRERERHEIVTEKKMKIMQSTYRSHE